MASSKFPINHQRRQDGFFACSERQEEKGSSPAPGVRRSAFIRDCQPHNGRPRHTHASNPN